MTNRLECVLCLCPAGRFFLTSLALSTWSHVRCFVLTEEEPDDLAEFDAAIVMDDLITKDRVDRLATKMPVFVLAWNGLFEIRRYRDALGPSANVTYVGTDDRLAEATAEQIRYLPMIDGRCAFAEWRLRSRNKSQFVVRGNTLYQVRWRRTMLFANRRRCVEISVGSAATKRPRTLFQTIASGLITERLVWAGHCQYDIAPLGLPGGMRRSIDAAVERVRGTTTPDDRLAAGRALIDLWIAEGVPAVAPGRQHEAFYVTNTLLRWAALRYLIDTVRPFTWFFGSDNVGIGLNHELDVYHLVGSRRVVYLDFGGKTSEHGLYPRALHLLARRCYVLTLGVPQAVNGGREFADTLINVRDRLARSPRSFFDELEARRQAVYDGLPRACMLEEAHRRVWRDFDRYAP